VQTAAETATTRGAEVVAAAPTPSPIPTQTPAADASHPSSPLPDPSGDDPVFDPLWSLESVQEAIRKLDTLNMYPLIVKPDDSYASCGITKESVVFNAKQTLIHAALVQTGFNGVFMEKFIAGREFSGLVTGDAINGVRTFDVAERIFDTNLLQWQEQFVSFQLFWEIGKQSQEKDEWWYGRAPDELQERLQKFVRDAYLAVKGSGYARVDIRMDADGRLYALEVNANCGISGYAETLTGHILRASRFELPSLFDHFFQYALARSKSNANDNQNNEGNNATNQLRTRHTMTLNTQ